MHACYKETEHACDLLINDSGKSREKMIKVDFVRCKHLKNLGKVYTGVFYIFLPVSSMSRITSK